MGKARAFQVLLVRARANTACEGIDRSLSLVLILFCGTDFVDITSRTSRIPEII